MLAGLIKFLFWFFCISYFIKLIIRIFAPFLLKRFANRMQQSFQQRYQNSQHQTEEEGKVTLEKTRSSVSSKSDNVGDYVDFEEVEE